MEAIIIHDKRETIENLKHLNFVLQKKNEIAEQTIKIQERINECHEAEIRRLDEVIRKLQNNIVN